jgi:hypothetical protein
VTAPRENPVEKILIEFREKIEKIEKRLDVK